MEAPAASVSQVSAALLHARAQLESCGAPSLSGTLTSVHATINRALEALTLLETREEEAEGGGGSCAQDSHAPTPRQTNTADTAVQTSEGATLAAATQTTAEEGAWTSDAETQVAATVLADAGSQAGAPPPPLSRRSAPAANRQASDHE